jgi:ATP-dependent protease HslVU (ClpYQ) ATPase subunit
MATTSGENPCQLKHCGIVFLDEIDIVTVRKPVHAAVRDRNVVRDILGELGAAHESTD